MLRILSLFLAMFLLSAPGLAHAGVDDDDSGESSLVVDDDDSGTVAPASVEIPAIPDVSDADALGAVNTLLDHQRSGWGPIIAALLTLIIFAVRKTGALNKVPKKAMPLVAVAVAMVGDVSAALVAGSTVPDAMLQGLMLGAAAVGFWEIALKHVLAPKKDSPAAEA
jgi:hypothetical protein